MVLVVERASVSEARSPTPRGERMGIFDPPAHGQCAVRVAVQCAAGSKIRWTADGHGVSAGLPCRERCGVVVEVDGGHLFEEPVPGGYGLFRQEIKGRVPIRMLHMNRMEHRIDQMHQVFSC